MILLYSCIYYIYAVQKQGEAQLYPPIPQSHVRLPNIISYTPYMISKRVNKSPTDHPRRLSLGKADRGGCTIPSQHVVIIVSFVYERTSRSRTCTAAAVAAGGRIAGTAAECGVYDKGGIRLGRAESRKPAAHDPSYHIYLHTVSYRQRSFAYTIYMTAANICSASSLPSRLSYYDAASSRTAVLLVLLLGEVTHLPLNLQCCYCNYAVTDSGCAGSLSLTDLMRSSNS